MLEEAKYGCSEVLPSQGMTREKKTEILLQLCLYVHYDWMI